MIYEIFKSLAEDGLSWGEWCAGVVASLYLIHILCLVLSWCASWCYSYVHDFQKKKASFYIKLLSRLVNPPPEPEVKEVVVDIPDGIYNTHGYWHQCTVISGVIKKVDDNIHRGKDHHLITPEYGEGTYRLTDGKWKVGPDGVPVLSSVSKAGLADKIQYTLWLGPVAVAFILLFFDTFPVAAASVAIAYAVLRTARGLVRTVKRVDKLEVKAKDTPEA